jgi:hypothetical protein
MVSMALQAVSSVYLHRFVSLSQFHKLFVKVWTVTTHIWSKVISGKRLENIMDAKVLQMGFERNEKQAKTADAIRMRCMRGGILIGLGEIQRMAKKPDPVSTFLIRSS